VRGHSRPRYSQAAEAVDVLLSPEDVFDSEDEDSFDAVEDDAEVDDELVDVVDVEVEGALPLLRKSVTYQPVPFSWKPAAVSCFLNVLFPQDGHSVSGASDTFCNTSLLKPQSSQR
jgi:hypothetical protein